MFSTSSLKLLRAKRTVEAAVAAATLLSSWQAIAFRPSLAS